MGGEDRVGAAARPEGDEAGSAAGRPAVRAVGPPAPGRCGMSTPMAIGETTGPATGGADPFPTTGPLASISLRCSDIDQVVGLIDMCGRTIDREAAALERLYPEAPVQYLREIGPPRFPD